MPYSVVVEERESERVSQTLIGSRPYYIIILEAYTSRVGGVQDIRR